MYDDHAVFKGVARPIARSVVVYAKDGQVDRRFLVRDVAAITRADIIPLVQVPSESSPDPVRGWDGQSVQEFPGAPGPSPAAAAGGIAKLPVDEDGDGGLGLVVISVCVIAGVVVAAVIWRRMS